MKFLNATFSLLFITVLMTLFIQMKLRIFNMKLFFIEWFHFTTFGFTLLYPFLYDKNYDLIYIIINLIIGFSWAFIKEECILSLWEKQIINPNYKSGDDVYQHPFLDNIFDSKLMTSVLIITSFIVFIFIGIRYSYTTKTLESKILALALIILGIHNIYNHIYYKYNEMSNRSR